MARGQDDINSLSPFIQGRDACIGCMEIRRSMLDCTWMQQHILWFYTGTLSGRNFAPFIKARQVKSRQGLLGSNARRQGHDIEFT